MARTIRREEVAFPSAPDPRFGGNMARATEGAQYTGSPRDYYGGPSKGSPMHDARYGNYVAPHRVDYTRNPQAATKAQYAGPSPSGMSPRPKHPNPRMRGMMGGLGGLQEKSQLRRPENFTNLDMVGRPDLSFKYSHMDYPEIHGTWRRMEDARNFDEMDEYGYLEGAPRQRTTFTEGYTDPEDFNEMYGGVYDDEILRGGGIGSTNEYQTAGLWQDWKRIFDKTGNAELADYWIESQRAV